MTMEHAAPLFPNTLMMFATLDAAKIEKKIG